MKQRRIGPILIEEALQAIAIFAILFLGGTVPLVRLFGVRFWPALLGRLTITLMAFFVLTAARLTTGRDLKVQSRRKALIIAVAAIIGISLAIMWFPQPFLGHFQGFTIQERLRGETPEAKVSAYMRAILRGDEEAALGAWTLHERELPDGRGDALRERRDQVTRELVAAGLHPDFTIEQIEWWTTCCEPGVTGDIRNAGGARIHVRFLDSHGKPQGYVFDVFHRDEAYWGAAMGYQPRRWVLYDVYPSDEDPLYWRFVYDSGVSWRAWPPEAR
jgi:hypothetical protein